MACINRIVVGRALYFPGQLLQRLPLRLWDQERGDDTAQHEQSENLHYMIQPPIKISTLMEGATKAQIEQTYGDDAAALGAPARARVRSGPKIVCAMMAPTLPEAAEMPWELER